MDHKVAELDTCVFDYLTSHPDEPKSFTQIYNDISGTTGHRCSELQNMFNRQKYKDLFMTICYTLDNKWDNIHKIYINDKPYLIFSNKPKAEVVTEFQNIGHTNSIFIDNATPLEYDNIIDYMTSADDTYPEFSFVDDLNIDENLLQYLVKKNKIEKLKKILALYDINLNEKVNGKTLLDCAVENNYTEMVKELMIQEMNNQKNEYEANIKKLKKLNTKLQDEKIILDLQNKTLKNELANQSSVGAYMGGGFFVIMFMFLLMSLFR